MTNQTSNNILACAHQIGGANAIGPVIIDLKAESYNNVKVIGYNFSANGFNKQDIDYHDPFKNTNENRVQLNKLAQKIIRNHKPDLLLCGTSDGYNLEKALLVYCKKLKIPTVAVLDNWTNLDLRFSDAENDLNFLPDKLAVMDDYTRIELEKLGISEDVIEITGQPYLDKIIDFKNNTKKSELRNKLNINPEQILITFVSEPHSHDYGTDGSFPLYKGFTEIDVLDGIVKTINNLVTQIGTNIHLKIKLHPKELNHSFGPILKTANFSYEIIQETNQWELVFASDIVIGIESILLVESAILGTPTISFQPGLATLDQLYCNKIGLTIPIYSKNELSNTIKILLTKKNSNLTRCGNYILSYSSRKVINLINSLI
jgi:predicted glycosyltransferase